MFANQSNAAQAEAVSAARVNHATVAGQQCGLGAAVERNKAAPTIIEELESIISRMMSVSDRQETLANKLFGAQPCGKEESGSDVVGSGAIGLAATKLIFIRRILDAMENNLYRLEQMA